MDDSNTEGFQYLKQDSNIFKRSDNLSHPETNQEFAESAPCSASTAYSLCRFLTIIPLGALWVRISKTAAVFEAFGISIRFRQNR